MSSVMGREALNGGESAVSEDTAVRVAEYVCGLLESTEHAQVHVLLSRDDQALGVALAWEEELLALVDVLPPEQPSPALRHNLQKTLAIGPPPAPSQTELLRRRSLETGGLSDGAMPAPNQQIAVRPGTGTPSTSAISPGGTGAHGRDPAAASVIPERAIGSEAPAAADASTPTAAGSSTSASISAAAATISTPALASTAGPSPSPSPASTSARTSTPASESSSEAITRSAVPPEPSNLSNTSSGRNPKERTPRERTLHRKLWFWRLIGLAATAAAIAGFMIPREPPPPPVQIVKVAPTRAAILLAPGTSSTPAWTATFDADGNLMMQPLVNTEVPTGSQTLLWTRSAQIPEPRLLGSIDPNRPVQVPAATFGKPSDDQLLEITLETDEDAVLGTPNGPILYIGQMTTFASDAAVTGASAGPAGAPGAEATRDGDALPGAAQGTGSPASGLITK